MKFRENIPPQSHLGQKKLSKSQKWVHLKIKLSSQVHIHPYMFKKKKKTEKKTDWMFSHSAVSTNPLCSCISSIFIKLFRFFYPWKAWNCLVKDNWTKINQQCPEINRQWKMTEYVKCITLSDLSQSSTSAASFILLIMHFI